MPINEDPIQFKKVINVNTAPLAITATRHSLLHSAARSIALYKRHGTQSPSVRRYKQSARNANVSVAISVIDKCSACKHMVLQSATPTGVNTTSASNKNKTKIPCFYCNWISTSGKRPT
mmetsp:Transcript_6796/g.13399  ORF Transcript_6796/g.13399 Transcript_6796/m.13399 type:complete len:119 (-) Transcript_6796:83-439(-)